MAAVSGSDLGAAASLKAKSSAASSSGLSKLGSGKKQATTRPKEKMEERPPKDALNSTNQQEGDHDSGVDEHTQNTTSSNKKAAAGPPKARSRAPVGHRPVPRSKSVPKPFTSWATPPSTSESVKKVPMNKIKVGMSQSPNLKQVKSKIGSMDNAQHRPGGGDVKIENKKLGWKKEARTVTENSTYKPGGGDKKIEIRKLEWNTGSKIGSLENAKHKAGGGNVKIVNEKRVYKVQSKVGSMDNVQHKAGGGNIKVYNDVDYLRQMSEHSALSQHSGSMNSSRRESGSQSSSRKSSNNSCHDPYNLKSLSSAVDQSLSKPGGTSFQYQIKRRLTPASNGF